MLLNKLSFCLLVVSIDVSWAYGTFPIKYIGNFLTIEAYENLTLCDSSVCLMDSQRLVDDMSYDTRSNPCEGFKNFSCGTFYQFRAENERYDQIGFRRDYELRNDEKRHKALKAKIQDGDGKAVRVVKNFYQKCIDWSESKTFKFFSNFLSFFCLSRAHWTG